jgi:Tn3 transposase DDE domain/Phage integrase family
MAEVGRAQRTIFIARYLRDRDLQREIGEGLNVVESWNHANAVIFFGKGGDIATNRRDEQELSVLCLRILQAALVYVNTLMVQDVLADQAWVDRLTAEDRRGMTPLFWTHVAPDGEFGSIWAAACPARRPGRPAGGPVTAAAGRGAARTSGAAQGPAARQVPSGRTARLRLPQGSIPVPSRGAGRGVARAPKKLPYVPTEAEIRAFYEAVWRARRAGDVILIKTLLYTGVRVSELVRIRIADVDLDTCRIRTTQGKGRKDRIVPFPAAFKETLALHIDAQRRAGAVFLFESSWKKPYSDHGVRKILARYTQAAGITASISPHTLRHFLLPRPRRCAAALRRCHRRLPSLTSAITLVCGW